MSFEIQEYTLFDGWINNWVAIDEDGEAEIVRFESKNMAEIALSEYLHDLKRAVADGYMEDLPSRESYRIVEVMA